MRYIPIRILISFTIILAFTGIQSFSQELTKTKIENIDFQLQEGKIVITYDLLRSEKTERFIVSVNAITESGDTIPARSLTGDVNENVSGGRKKTILWDYQRDNFFTREAFHIEVFALPQMVDISELSPYDSYPGLGKSILMTTVYPGWASTKLKDGKPHWIKGIAGYGCLAMAFVYNNKAVTSYDNYQSSMIRKDRNSFYDDAVSQKQLSSVFAFSALAVWVMDYTCIIISHNKLIKNAYNAYEQKISFGYDVDPITTQPLLSVRLTF
jgi:hypothetical protein